MGEGGETLARKEKGLGNSRSISAGFGAGLGTYN